VLDAQYFGVAQRRRRVFVVGYLGDWRRAAAVLFERESMSGHPAPSREAGKEVAGTVTTRSGSGGGGGLGTDEACSGYLQPTWPAEIASTLNAAFGDKQGLEDQHINSGAPLFVPDSVDSICARTGRSISVQDAEQAHLLPIAFGAQNSANQGDSVSTEVTPTLDKSKTPAVAFAIHPHSIGRKPNAGPQGRDHLDAEQAYTHDARGVAQAVAKGHQVRRLTPTECERLQGFPDDFTQIPWRNKPAEDCPDGPRYKAMGNSMAVPVMRWIGERIQMVESLDD